MKTITKQDEPKPSVLSTYHLAFNFIGYVSFFNALIALHKKCKNDKNILRFMEFANTVMLKDFAIIINEIYNYIKSGAPDIFKKMCDEQPRLVDFLSFIKKIRNNMKFLPKRKTINAILNSLSNKFPNNFGIKNKNDIVYHCGYFFGNNVVFGSNLYSEYIFFEPKKICTQKDDLFLFTNDIFKNIHMLFKVFEKVVFKDDVNIPKIIVRKRKRFFQIYQQTTKFDKMVRKSKYNKYTVFIFMLIVEEIYSAKVYFEYIFDMDSTIKDSYLLFFFSQYIAIKYDQIRDALELLVRDGNKFGVDYIRLKKEVEKLNIFSEDVKLFVGKLRNSHHCTEFSKYILNGGQNFINLTELYLSIAQLEKWPDDYIIMLNKMRYELDIILKFCSKNIGIHY